MDLNFSQTLPKTVEFASGYPEVVVAVAVVMVVIFLFGLIIGRLTKRKMDDETVNALAFHRGYNAGIIVGKASKKPAEA